MIDKNQTLIITLVVFVGGALLLAFAPHVPDGTSQAIFALWGAAATNIFNLRAAGQSADLATHAAATAAAQAASATAATLASTNGKK